MDEQKDLLSQIGGNPPETGAVPSGSFDPAGGNSAGVEEEKDPGGTGNFTGNIRGDAKGVTRVNKMVKAAVWGTLVVAVGLVFFGVEHHGSVAKSAKAPHTTMGSGALAPNLHLESGKAAATAPGSVTAITGSTGGLGATGEFGGKTPVVAPVISSPIVGSQAAKELAELKKIRWQSEKQQYTAREDAKDQKYQAYVQDSNMAAHANPNMTFAGAPKAKAVPVAQQQPMANPNTANPTIGVPPYPQAGGGAGGGKYAQENDQAAKEAFLAKAEKAHNHEYLHQIEKRPLSPFELQAGSVIPATLITAIDSDNPGQIFGQVSQSVYSDINGELLIPEGTKLVGMYNSGVSYGQNRVQVVWSRMIFPNGNSMSMGFEGAGPGGESGFHDLTNTHFWSIMGDALMYSVLGAVPELASGSNTNTSGGTSVGQALAQSTGQEMAQTGQ
ncbi:MAG: TrbI/VirB10 family protein [Cellulomonas sp.]